MKRVLVTGGSGFVGRNCLPALADRGFEVHVISSRKTQGPFGRWHQVDLMDPLQVRQAVKQIQPSHLLHLAWITQPGRYSHAAENVDWLSASLCLMRAFHEAGGTRIVMTGSCAEYDWKHGVCREEVTPIKPSTLYGQSKHVLQTMLSAYAQQVGLSWGWGRLFFLYGPHAHESRIPGVIIQSLLRNERARCSHGLQRRDFLHITDAADALVTLLDSDVQGPINIGSGEAIPIRDIGLQIADYFHRRDLIDFGAVATPPDDPPLLVADVHRLHEELGWRPLYSLKSGLNATLEWYRGGDHDIAC